MKSPLQLDQPGFVLANACELARRCADIYLPFSALSWDGIDMPLVTPVDCSLTDTHALVVEWDDCIYIVFRGTKDLRNWITDAEFGKDHTPDGQVHEGFLAAIDSVIGRIIEVLQPTGFNRLAHKQVILTGHSLGGALAVLCAWLLKGFPIHSVHTFGQPRVGDKAFCAAYDQALRDRTFRVVNCNDIVARVPGWLLGYRHVGNLEFINASGEIVENPSLFGLLLSDALGLCRAYRQLDDVLVTEHFMSRYIAALAVPHQLRAKQII
jgi:triacylglycerol lipase